MTIVDHFLMKDVRCRVVQIVCEKALADNSECENFPSEFVSYVASLMCASESRWIVSRIVHVVAVKVVLLGEAEKPGEIVSKSALLLVNRGFEFSGGSAVNSSVELIFQKAD